jgi:hypothetical protein
MKTLIYLPVLLVISTIAAHAQLVNYNVSGDMTGPAVLGNGPSDQWNQTGGTGVVSDAVDSNGNTDTFVAGHPVTITLGNFFILEDGSTTDGALDGPSPSDPLAPDLFANYSVGVGFFGNGSGTDPATISYTGLADNAVYTLELYSRNQPDSSGREFTVTAPGLLGNYSETLINEESPTYTSNVDLSLTDLATYGTPVFEGNYIQLVVKSDGSGDLTLDLKSGSAASGFTNGGEFDVTGAQIEAGVVPEPSTVSILAAGLGMLGLLVYHRRHNKLA